MPMPFLESNFPTEDLDTPLAIGRVAGIGGVAGIGAIRANHLHGDDITARYWAALRATADARALQASPELPAEPAVIIAQHDSLRLHHDTPPENPFVGLIEHQLHIHLPHVHPRVF